MSDQALYVPDTHSLLWYLYDIPRLGPEARAVFDAVSRGARALISLTDVPEMHDRMIVAAARTYSAPPDHV